jgi:hypothetical protein
MTWNGPKAVGFRDNSLLTWLCLCFFICFVLKKQKMPPLFGKKATCLIFVSKKTI